VPDTIVIERFLRLKEVARVAGVNPVTIRKWTEEGRFPQSYRLSEAGPTAPVGWKESEVQAWIDSRTRGHSPGTPQAWAGRREAARQARNIREGRTPKFGFKRCN
jgi:predicted DNA-binding transcriptional regulator AlpA